MLAASTNRTTSEDLLRRVLLEYLLASRVAGWPGTDGLTEDDVLDCYPQANAAGQVPGWQELCRRHTELVAEIQAYFRLRGWLNNDDSR